MTEEARIRKTTPLQLEFGRLLKSKRKKACCTQESLAEKANMTHGYLSSVERGERNISLGNIVALATALGIPPRELVPSVNALDILQRRLEIGQRIKRKRQALGLSQKQLAEQAELDIAEVESMEKAGIISGLECLIAMAQVLKIPPKELIP